MRTTERNPKHLPAIEAIDERIKNVRKLKDVGLTGAE